MQIGAFLRQARLEAKLTQQQVAAHFGITKTSVSEWETDKGRPDMSKLPDLARLYNTTVAALLGEQAPLVLQEPRPHYGATDMTMQPILAWEHEDDLPEGEFVMIPRLDVHLSAGSGKEQVEIDFVEKQPQAFRADWIRKKHLKPAKLASMIASGDSMEDRIHDGDALVVDTSQTIILDGKVYALWYDGGERVKRLYRLPGGGLRIKSDNDAYAPIELTAAYAEEHVRIIGRVVHIAGEGGL